MDCEISEKASMDRHAPQPTSSIPATENTVWADASPLLEAACRELRDGELIHGENFNLFAAMSALEIMDPKMDSGIISRYCSVDEAIEDGAAPIPISFDKTSDVQCTIDIMDYLLACEATWHKGHSLAQTVFSCIYLLRPERTASHTLLDSFCKVIRATCKAVVSVVSDARTHEEEDLFIMAYGLPLNVHGDDKCLSLLNAVEENISRQLRACKAPSSKRKVLEDIEPLQANPDMEEGYCKALLCRIRFRKHFFHVLTCMKRPQGRGMELARKHIATCISELESIYKSAEFLMSNASGTREDGTEDRTTASGCQPVGFDTSLNCRISAPTPPRSIKLLSWKKAIEYFEKLLQDLDLICSFMLGPSLEVLLHFLVQFQKSQPDLVARAHLQLLLVQDGKLYGRDPIFSVITRAAGLPEAAKNHDIQKNEYIIQLGQLVINMLKILCTNAAWQRRKLGKILQDWRVIYVQLELAFTKEYREVSNNSNNESASVRIFNSDVRILGIWGMGGIGKTTVAGAVFKQIACQFEGCCFLANIGKESEKSGGLTRLGEELLSKVLEEREVRINTPDIESSYFKDMLHRKKVLIVLDDVNNIEQLEFLAGDHCWFGTGSRIIITSRDKQVLKKSVDVMYEVKELNYSEALHLFSRNAFKQSNPLDDFVLLSNLVVRYARGNPLALKVLGSMLFEKSKIEWESALKKLEKGPQMNIQHVLKLSYDNLDEEEQHIFLHIACLFEGEDRDSVARALDGCGFSTDIGIGTLVDKSLVTIKNNKLKMHDLLREVGREIVRRESKRPSERSRLWNHDDIYKVFEENNGTEAIEGIILDTSRIQKLELNPNAFARMSNLKFLIFRMSSNHGDFEEECKLQLPTGLDSLPRELRYLYWDGYPLASLPANLPSNLVELNLPCSKVEMPWEGAKVPSTISQLNKLTVMSLKHSKNISSLPTNVDLPSLKTLDLYGCSNLNKFPEVSRNVRYLYLNETAIEEVPLSIECLSKLVILNMKSCTKLKCLPNTICKLKSLEIFILSGCTSLDTFPEILETMDHLQHLDLDETPIVNLSESICNLKALQVLDLSDCSKLENLPKNIKNLHLLEELRARGCNLLKLPAELKYLSSIVELNLSGNSFDRISADIEHLSKLRWLNVSSCKQIQSLPELPPRIKYVNARDCVSLESISGLKQLFELGYSNSLTDETFVFTNCYKLDQEKWGDIVARVQLKIQHFAMGGKCCNRELYPASSVCFTYPASEIPEWFTGKSIGNSVTIQHLPPHWLNDRFLGFAVCVIVAFDDQFICDFPRGVISCKCNFENNYAGDSSHIFTLESWKYFPARSNGSKHVFLWYDCRWYDTIVAKSDWLNECWCNKVSFEFSAEILDCYIGANVQEEGKANCPQVEKCGVHLLCYKDE